MLHLLESEIIIMTLAMIIFSVLTTALIVGLIVWVVVRSNKINNERLSRVNNIEYTQILSSVGGVSGSVITHGNEGMNHGTYSSAPRTKFLVVYFSGEREIVTVNDNSTLCKEYLLRLKKDN